MTATVAAFGLLLAAVAYVLSQLGFRGARAFSALSLLAILLALSVSAGESVSELGKIGELAGMSEIAKPAVKIVFIGYVFGFCSDIASELGETGIANAVVLGGRLEMLLVTLPYINDIVELAVGLI